MVRVRRCLQGHRTDGFEVDVLEGAPGHQVGQRGVAFRQPGGQGGRGGRARTPRRPGSDRRASSVTRAPAPECRRPARPCRARRGRRRTSPVAPVAAVSSAGVPSRTTRPGERMTMRSAIFSASASSWVVSSTQTPWRAEVGHHGPDGQAALGVDAGGRLVEEDHLGTADEGQGEREPLLLAAGEMAPRAWRPRAQRHQVEQGVGGERVRVVGGEEVEDPARAEHRVDAAPLQHDADAAGQPVVVGDRVEPEHRDAPPGRAAGSPRATRWSRSCRRRSARARRAPRPARPPGEAVHRGGLAGGP